jgi:hypothetical protein
MLMTPTKPQPSSRAVPNAIHQICITHCLHDEGVYRQAGFTVRACSTLDPLLIRFALEYPLYEVPIRMSSDEVAAAPRRLALVRIPGGQSALIHSVYAPEDSRGRANNFFSHILVQPALTAREALTAWASSQWRTHCEPDAGTDLPPLEHLPQGQLVSDEAVTAFLRPESLAVEDNPGTLTCPSRLVEDERRRRELVRLVLRGCVLALQSSSAAARSRFYLLAEPGLTALLLYAAARLMPDALAANLIFSTYENAHRDLRTYKHARVVGTYLADPSRGLEAEFYTTRGYALDTFQHQFSPELSADADPAIDEWIELAARGDWATIDKVHRLLGKTSTSVLPFKEGAQAARISLRLASGQAGADDLLTLKSAAWGPAILEEHRGKIWPLVRESSLTDSRVREAFADVLRLHLKELEQQVSQDLAAQPPGDWRRSWRLLCAVLKEDPTRLRDTLQRALPEPPYAPGLRLEMLREMHRAGLSPMDQKQPWHSLLKNCSPDELDQFASAQLPPEWFVWALIYALLRTEGRATAVHHLHAGDDNLLAVFWGQFKLFKDHSQRRAILAPLFPADRPEGVSFFGRLLKLRPTLRVETLEWLLETFNAFSPEGASFWGRENHLGSLFDMMRTLGEEASPLWDRLCGLLTSTVLPPGDPYQNTVLMELAAAKARPGPALPRATAQAVEDWILLRDHFEKATDVPESGRRAVIDACNRLRFDSIDVLGRYFHRFILPQGINPAVLEDFVGFFHSFFLAGMEHQDYASRLIAWLQIVAACPDEAQRASYQQFYLENHVPLEFRWRLTEETHTAGRLSPIVFERLQQMKPQKTATAAVPSASVAAGSIDELFHLTGLAPTQGLPTSLPAALRKRAPLLLGLAAAGLLAAWLTHVYQVQLQRVAALVLFVPVVLLLAESMATQAVVLALRALREGTASGAPLARRIGKEMLAGLLLGLVCGVAVATIVGATMRSLPLALSVGAALIAGLAFAAGIGGALPSLLLRLRCEQRIAAGPTARALADLITLFLYLGLSCLLIR